MMLVQAILIALRLKYNEDITVSDVVYSSISDPETGHTHVFAQVQLLQHVDNIMINFANPLK